MFEHSTQLHRTEMQDMPIDFICLHQQFHVMVLRNYCHY